MSNELSQWLSEIKSLRQQLADCFSDRDAANESADKWRQLYNNEAQQRRTEARLAQQQLESLKSQLQDLQGEVLTPQSDSSQAESMIEQELAKLESVEDLKAKLKDIILERDRLLDALKAEQANHAQTRKNLTAVIGDTMEQLNKERANQR
jgi:chromosome segregation ATPase